MKYFLYEILLKKKIKGPKSVYTTVQVNKVNNYPPNPFIYIYIYVYIYIYAYMFTYGYLGTEESTGG